MLGERGLAVLDSLVSGRMDGVVSRELHELAAHGFAVAADPDHLRRASDVDAAAQRHGVRTPDGFARALDELDERLRSDFHRLTTFSAKLWQEEEDRARLRNVVGMARDAELWDAVTKAGATLRAAAPQAPFHGCPGTPEVWAITTAGRCAATALRVRLDRFGRAAFADFVKRFSKADRGMAALAEQHAQISRGLPHVPKGRTSVVVGLLKSGLPAGQALQTYRVSEKAARVGRLPVELPHVATTLVRGAGATRTPQAVLTDLDTAYRALRAQRLPDGAVLRGAAKSLLGSPDLAASAQRFRNLVTALEARGVAGDDRLRFSARLMPAQGTPEAAVQRAADAATRLSRRIGEASVALAAMSSDAASLVACTDRFVAILHELIHRRAFVRAVPDSAVQLVGVAGTPAEVVELVRQLVAHLPAREFDDRWGTSDDWEVAVAFAKRFAY